MPVHWLEWGEGSHLEAPRNDAGLGALASGKVLVQRVDEPCPEVQHVPLLLYGEALVAAAHHCLHELVGADLHNHYHHYNPCCFRSEELSRLRVEQWLVLYSA